MSEKNKKYDNCIEQIAILVGKNAINEAFNLLKQYLNYGNFESRLTEIYVVKMRDSLAEQAFGKGVIQFQDYRIEKTNIGTAILYLTREVCDELVRLRYMASDTDTDRSKHPRIKIKARPTKEEKNTDLSNTLNEEQSKYGSQMPDLPISKNMVIQFERLIDEINSLELKSDEDSSKV